MDAPDAGTPPPPPVPARDSGAPVDPRLLLAQDLSIAKRLTVYAYKKTHDVARAKDAAQRAVARVLDGSVSGRWTPAGKTLLGHLADVVDTVVADENMLVAGENPPHPPDPGMDQRRDHRLAGEVLMRVQRDSVIPRMLSLAQGGLGDATELARRLECPLNDIHRARERLVYHRDAVLEHEKKKKRGGP
jgi:hypothetical protein